MCPPWVGALLLRRNFPIHPLRSVMQRKRNFARSFIDHAEYSVYYWIQDTNREAAICHLGLGRQN